MGKFKVGDKVRLVKPDDWSYGAALGTVIETGGYYGYKVQFEDGSLPVFEREIRLDSATPVAYGTGSTATPISNYTRKTKVQLVQIIENQKAEITKLVKEVEGLKNLKPAIAVQPVQAGQLVETVKRTRPKVGEQIFWAKHELRVGDIIGGFCTNVGEYEVTGPWIEGPWGHYPVKKTLGDGWGGFQANHDGGWKMIRPVDAPKIPPLDPKKAWIKKGATARIDMTHDAHYYEFTGDPVYDQEWGYWKVPTKIIRKNGKNSDIDFVSVEFGWEPYTPEKPKTFWDLVKVGDKIKVPLMYCGKVDRTYTGRVHLVDRAGLSVQVSFIVDTVEGASVWKPGQKASIYKGTFDLGACEILKD